MNTSSAQTHWHKVYDLLVALGGAREADRAQFIHHITNGCREWRFQGSLGFGGKLYRESPLRVSCYPEDMTAARAYTIETLNVVLRGLGEVPS